MTSEARILTEPPASGVVTRHPDEPPAAGPPLASTARIERLEVLDADGRDLVGLWRNVLVIALRTQPTAARLRRLDEIQRAVAARFPGGFVALAILPNLRAFPFDDDLREEAVRLTSSTPPELLAVAEIIEGKGFIAASIRSIATGMVFIARPKWAMRVFPGVEPAAAWLARWVDKGDTSVTRRLVEAVKHTLV
jgi:hypothetical protein